MLPTSADAFAEFGPSKYVPYRPSARLELSADYRGVRAQLRAECPDVPGVYGMVDCAGRLVYVGKSRNLRERTTSYFQKFGPGSLRPARKQATIAARARSLVWEPAGHELLALLREHELIRRFSPEMNVRGRQRRPLVYLLLSLDEAPRFKVAATLPKGCRHHWGPVARTGGLLRAVELLNRHFRLPDCPPEIGMYYREQNILFSLDLYPKCLRGELNGCLAPCAGTVSRANYTAQLAQARAFLDGRDERPLAQLSHEFDEAVRGRRFEHAALLHEARVALSELRDRLLPRPGLLPQSFVYTLSRGSRMYWLAVHDGAIMKVARVPRGERERQNWYIRLTSWQSEKSQTITAREGGELSIVAAWFRQNPAEIAHVVDFQAVRDMCSGGPRR